MERLTQTQLKLRDAGIQMKLALQHGTDDDVFRSCINAFIAAARSVTMVMEQESSGPELTAWYKQQTSAMERDPVCRFFVSQRNITIHRGVVHPQRASFEVTKAEWWRYPRPAGETNSAGRFFVKGEEPPADVGDVIFAGPGQAITWSFPSARQFIPVGSINVVRLCEEYFVRLKLMVHEWLKKRVELGAAETAG